MQPQQGQNYNQDTTRGVNPPGLPIFVSTFFLSFVFSFIIDFLHAVTATLTYPHLINTSMHTLETELTAFQRKGDSSYTKDYPSWAGLSTLVSNLTYWGLLIYAITIMCKSCGCNCGDDCCGNSKGSWANYCCNCCALPNGIIYVSIVGLHALTYLLSTIGMLVSDGHFEPTIVISYSVAIGWVLAMFAVVFWIAHIAFTVAKFIPDSNKHWEETGGRRFHEGQQQGNVQLAPGQILGAPIIAGAPMVSMGGPASVNEPAKPQGADAGALQVNDISLQQTDSQ